MLYIGEKVGGGADRGPKIDIALDPLEGTTITAKAAPMRSRFWRWPRRATCSTRPTSIWTSSRSARAIQPGIIDLEKTATENVHAVAEARASSRTTSWSACSTARATRS